jgi:hypothetical protein
LRLIATSAEPNVIWPGRLRQALRDLVVAAGHAVLLVGGTEDPQLALAGEGQQVEQVEAALLGRFRAVLDVVGDVEELAEP